MTDSIVPLKEKREHCDTDYHYWEKDVVEAVEGFRTYITEYCKMNVKNQDIQRATAVVLDEFERWFGK